MEKETNIRKHRWVERYIFETEEEARLKLKELRREYKRKGYNIILRDGKDLNNKFYIYIYKKTPKLFKQFKPLTDNEFKKMLKYCKNSKERMLLLLLYYTGRRVSEIIYKNGIRYKDIDIDSKTIYFTILKKNINERVPKPMVEKLIPELKKYIIDNKIYTHPNKLLIKYSRQWAYKVIKRLSEEADIKKRVFPHLFRHTFASQMAKNAKTPQDVLIIQDLLEHSDIKLTYHYIKSFNQEEKKELLEKTFD